MTLIDYMCQEKMEEEDLQASKIVLTHQYNDSKTSEKSVEEDWLQPPKTILTTRGPAERQEPENKSGKKNNFVDVLSD